MFVVSEETKKAYKNRISRITEGYKKAPAKLGPILNSYGKGFYEYAQGRYVEEYWREFVQNTKDQITDVMMAAITEAINALEALKTDYEAEMYNGESTTDPVELNIVAAELAVMDEDELESFYETACSDKNKMRLFDVEMKRRSRSGDVRLEQDVWSFELFKARFNENDTVLSMIRDNKKLFGGFAQLKECLWLLTENAPKMVPVADLLALINSRSGFSVPQRLDTLQLIEEL